MAGAHRIDVVADDRTGALEVAGMCADATGAPVLVAPLGALELRAVAPAAVSVVDVGTRHLPPSSAASIASIVAARTDAGGRAEAHKIDSTLRGNWAAELVARQRTGGRRVLVVPAFPTLGRRCIDGVVSVDGVPVADAGDARGGAASSRPSDLLRRAGAAAVVEVRAGASLDAWLAGAGAGDVPNSEFAVCDAAADDDLVRIGAAWARHAHEVLLAGTAASVAAGAGEWCGRSLPPPPPPVRGPALVVCGSLHPVARAQLAALRARGARDIQPGGTGPLLSTGPVSILASEIPDALPVTDAAATAAAEALGGAARRLVSEVAWGTVVLVGGDTAAAVIGDRAVSVRGTVAAGMPWSIDERTSALVVTKAGGFGDGTTLARVLSGVVGEEPT